MIGPLVFDYADIRSRMLGDDKSVPKSEPKPITSMRVKLIDLPLWHPTHHETIEYD
jgi:hypothetical protein